VLAAVTVVLAWLAWAEGDDQALRAELLEMERVDRATRADLVARGELHRPGYHPEMEAVHRRHNARMGAIIDAHGWPGHSLVGEDRCRAAGFIVQHAILDPALQRRCVDLLSAAVVQDEAAPFMVALLTDRVLMNVRTAPDLRRPVRGSRGRRPCPVAHRRRRNGGRAAARGGPALAARQHGAAHNPAHARNGAKRRITVSYAYGCRGHVRYTPPESQRRHVSYSS